MRPCEAARVVAWRCAGVGPHVVTAEWIRQWARPMDR